MALLLGKWHGHLAVERTVDAVVVVVATLSLKLTSLLVAAATATTSDIDAMTLSIPSSFVLNMIYFQSFTQLSNEVRIDDLLLRFVVLLHHYEYRYDSTSLSYRYYSN